VQPRTSVHRNHLKTILFGTVAAFLVLSLLLYPEQAFDSALKGLKIWWDVVFPALLPFFVASEILMGFGVVHFMGVLLEPFHAPPFSAFPERAPLSWRWDWHRAIRSAPN